MVEQWAWRYVLDQPTSVLVVDDDPILREFAAVHLATPTATVEGAADGAAAWSLLAEKSFDVVICDIEMPNLNGFKLLEKIRSTDRFAHLPVIMLTSNEDIRSVIAPSCWAPTRS